MKRLLGYLLLVTGLLVGVAMPAQAQHGRHGGHGRGGHGYHGRGRGHMGPPPQAYRRGNGPRYDHAAPYRSYGGRNYYRRQPGPAIIIRP